MKAKDIKMAPSAQLKRQLDEIATKLGQARIDLATGRSSNTSQIGNLRRTLARAKTFLAAAEESERAASDPKEANNG